MPANALITDPCDQLERIQPRQGVAHGQPLRIAGEDAGDEGIGDVVEDLLVETSPDEGGDASSTSESPASSSDSPKTASLAPFESSRVVGKSCGEAGRGRNFFFLTM